MEQMIKELLEMVRNMTEQLSAMQEIIEAKDAQIAALTAKIEELTHKKNSSNSSTPPSTERLEKPKPKSLRTKSGRKPGGQTGHKGSGMKIDRKPDKTVPHHPVQCQGCPHAGQCQYKVSGTRYEYEVIVKTELIAHQVLSCTSCKMTGTHPPSQPLCPNTR